MKTTTRRHLQQTAAALPLLRCSLKSGRYWARLQLWWYCLATPWLPPAQCSAQSGGTKTDALVAQLMDYETSLLAHSMQRYGEEAIIWVGSDSGEQIISAYALLSGEPSTAL